MQVFFDNILGQYFKTASLNLLTKHLPYFSGIYVDGGQREKACLAQRIHVLRMRHVYSPDDRYVEMYLRLPV